MDDERWLPWPINPLIEASSQGRLRSLRTDRRTILAQSLKPDFRQSDPWDKARQYLHVAIGESGGKGRSPVHLIVCRTFHGPRPPGFVGAHLNGDRHDNRSENLAWVSNRDNVREHAIAHGRDPLHLGYKLDAAQIEAMRSMVAEGVPSAAICACFGVSHHTVNYHCDGGISKLRNRLDRSYRKASRRQPHPSPLPTQASPLYRGLDDRR